MAEKRMFTKKVTDDENFLHLSSSAQALYLHLAMSADDDGFSNQISTSMFKAHASIQDLEALLEKRYLYQFDNGVIVIKHWRMANALRKDRYTPTAFQEELAKLKVKDNGSYTWLPDGCQVVANRLPDGCHSIDKDREDKNRLDKGSSKFTPPTLEEVISYVQERNSSVDPVKFWTYYDTGGWKDAKGNAVKNWKQKLLTWERHDDEKPAAAPNQTKGRNIKAACNNYPTTSVDYLKSLVDKI